MSSKKSNPKYRARHDKEVAIEQAKELAVLREKCGTGKAFDLAAFNATWKYLHGPVDAPSGSIQSRQIQARKTSQQKRLRRRIAELNKHPRGQVRPRGEQNHTHDGGAAPF